MARRYHGTAKTISGDTFTVELWDGSTAATPDASIELIIADFELNYDKPENSEFKEKAPFGIMPSDCTVQFCAMLGADYTWSTDARTNLSNIALDEEQKWAIKILKNGSFYWAGRVLADQMSFPFSDKYEFICEIVAKDCLNLIDGYFVSSSWFSLNSSTRETAIVLIASILYQTGLINYFPNDVFADAIQITNASFPASNIGKTLAFTTLNKASFIDNFDVTLTSDKIKYLSCKEALNNILKPFGSRLMLSNGLYFITEPDAYQNSSFGYTTYGNNGVLNTYNTAFSHRVTSGVTTRPCWGAVPDISFQKPIRGIEIQWEKQNGVITERTTAASTLLQAVDSDLVTGGTLPGRVVKCKFQVEWYYSGNRTHQYKIEYLVYAKSGATYKVYSDYLGSWVSSSAPSGSSSYYKSIIPNPDYSVGKQIWTQDLQVGEPPSGYTIYAECRLVKQVGTVIYRRNGGYVDWTTPAESYIDFTGLILISQSFTNTDPYQWVSPQKYSNTLSSPRSNNSTKLEYPIKYHSGYASDVFGLTVFNGTTYVAPGNWSVSWHSDSGDISAVLAANITGLYTDFLQSINGTWHDAGSYHAAKSLYFDSSTWIFNGGKYNVKDDTWNGEWLKVDTDYTLYSSDGSGERTVQTVNDTLKDKLNVLEKSVADMRAIIGVLGKGIIIPDIINTATGAPSSDPGVNKKYPLSLTYNFSNVDFNYQVTELPATSKDKAVLLKSADQIVNNSDTLTDDDTLQFTMSANEVYNINMRVYFDTDATADFKWGVSGPASPTSVRGVARHFNPGGTTEVVDNFVAYVSSDSITGASSNGGWLWVNMIVQNGANSGTFKFKWSQNTSTVADTKVLAGSILEFVSEHITTAYNLALAQGSYTLTGQSLTMGFALSLPLAQGSYTLTGQAATLTYTQALLLDSYTGAAAAYGFRKLRTAYSGSAVRVRRSSDNTEQDIGFSGNNFDESALTSFVGSNSAYVVKWYDQSGNGNDAVQSTASLQPLIVSSGTVQKVNGKMAMYFDGSDDFLALTSAITTAYSYHNFNVNKRTGSGVRGILFCGTSYLPYSAFRNNDNYMYASGDAGYLTSSASSSSSNQELLTTKYVSGSENFYINGTVEGSGFTSFAQSADIVNIGGKDAVGQYSTAYAQEIIHYSSDQSSNQTAIESNIKTYFGL